MHHILIQTDKPNRPVYSYAKKVLEIEGKHPKHHVMPCKYLNHSHKFVNVNTESHMDSWGF